MTKLMVKPVVCPPWVFVPLDPTSSQNVLWIRCDAAVASVACPVPNCNAPRFRPCEKVRNVPPGDYLKEWPRRFHKCHRKRKQLAIKKGRLLTPLVGLLKGTEAHLALIAKSRS